MAGDIVLGYDGSDGSKAALRVAMTVARAFAAPLVVVFGYEVIPVGGETADYKKRVERVGAELVGEAVKAAGELDPAVKVEGLVVAERPVDSLLNVAEARQARVIVVGGNGSRPLMGVILGSVPHKLLHRATVPVLVVPGTED
jgi:nucleotide-binding universal stress UspA family protein